MKVLLFFVYGSALRGGGMSGMRSRNMVVFERNSLNFILFMTCISCKITVSMIFQTKEVAYVSKMA